MVDIKVLKVGMIRANCYIVSMPSNKECVVIDAGADYKKIKDVLEKNSLICKAVLCTHGHFDHVGALKEFRDSESAKVYAHVAETEMIENGVNQARVPFMKAPRCKIDVALRDGDTFNVAGMDITAIHTPGHTLGGVCYVIENNIFSGDTLFLESVGRTDFPGGSFEQIVLSINNKLFSLNGDYRVFPGHEEETTLNHERSHNPYLKG